MAAGCMAIGCHGYDLMGTCMCEQQIPTKHVPILITAEPNNLPDTIAALQHHLASNCIVSRPLHEVPN
jgi:hypothetical protein